MKELKQSDGLARPGAAVRMALVSALALILTGGFGTPADAAPPAPAPILSPMVAGMPGAEAAPRDFLAELASVDGPPELTEAVDGALAAGVRPELLGELIARASDTSIPPAQLLPVLRRLQRAAEAGLPADVIAGRYLQGLSKGVPLSRIHAVADELTARLEAAALHVDARCPGLGQPGREEERLQAVDSVAYALGAGVEPEFLDRSIDLIADENAPYEEVRAPVLAMSLLASMGIEGDRSFEVVSTAWAHGVRGGDLERLGESMVRLGQGGQEPHEVVAHVMGLLEKELPTETILHDLDALQTSPVDGVLPSGPAGDHPTRRRVPGDRPDNQSRDNFGGSGGRMADGSSGGLR